MKSLTLVSALVLASLSSASAITNADITPEALVGKTLTFTAQFSTAPFVASGTWTGKFETSPANGFTIIGMTGLPGNISTTQTSLSFGVFQLGRIYSGSGNAILSIYANTDGTAGYELNLTESNKDGSYQAGSFTIGTASVKGPEIDVKPQNDSDLTDGVGKTKFGNIVVTKTGVAKKFIIKNSGNAPLKNLAISIDGKNKSDFLFSALKKNQLADGESTEFTVKFKPSDFGTRNATIHISSNDKNENPFDIKLTGFGAGIK